MGGYGMKKYIFLAAFLSAALLAGMIFARPAIASMASRTEQAQAKEALEAIRQAYISKDAEAFFRFVSWASFFSGLELKFQLSDHFRDFSQIDLNLVVDHALPQKDKIFLNTHWQKRAVRNSSGNVETSSGSAGFLFRIKGDSAKLIDIQGQSPF